MLGQAGGGVIGSLGEAEIQPPFWPANLTHNA